MRPSGDASDHARAPAPATGPDEPAASGLFERSLLDWHDGQWAALASLTTQALQADPRRSTMALMAASAAAHRGDADDAQRWLGTASDWGATRSEVARMLIGDVHLELGQTAAALGDEAGTLKHLRASIDVTAPLTGEGAGALPRRLAAAWRQLGLPPDETAGMQPRSPLLLAQQLQRATDTVSAADWRPLQKRLARDLKELRSSIEASVRHQVDNAVRQIEAFHALGQLLPGSPPLPPLHGWAVSADFALELVRLVLGQPYDAVVEFGSGTSTVLIARALARPRTDASRARPLALSFDHLPAYHLATMVRLQEAAVAEWVQVVQAPLVPWQAEGGAQYPYYDGCADELAALRARLEPPAPCVLAVVDGPPASTGRHARYPALPLLLDRLAPSRIDLLLDDYRRDDETEVVRMWLALLASRGYAAELIELDLEKRAALVRARRAHPPGAKPFEPQAADRSSGEHGGDREVQAGPRPTSPASASRAAERTRSRRAKS